LLEGSLALNRCTSSKNTIQMTLVMERRWNYTGRVNRSTGRKTCPVTLCLP